MSLGDVSSTHIDELLRLTVERTASDLHVTVGLPPMIRIDGELQPTDYGVVNAYDSQRLVYDILTDKQIERFEQTHELDFSYGVPGVARFRFNCYRQRGSVAAAVRPIPTDIPDYQAIGLPDVVIDLCERSSGLVIVTGPTGSGKSTTLACMVDEINQKKPLHIITIEDPIEYLHRHKRAMINQRELGNDTESFHNALRAVLRENPDVVLVGEMRDLETVEVTLQIAETGHLVFATLHTRNAPQTVDRIIDQFPPNQQEQIRVLLANTLEAVIAQRLLPKLGTTGRVPAIEVMIASTAIKNLIREAKTHQMYSIIETGKAQGMRTMDDSLAELFLNGDISREDALLAAIDRERFDSLTRSLSLRG